MGYVFDSIFVFAFFMFFICSIVFSQLVPTNKYAWDALMSTAPSFPPYSSAPWDIFVNIFNFGYSYINWIIAKILAVLLFFIGILIVPFSIMLVFPYLTPIFMPLVAIFLFGFFDKVIPWAIQVIRTIISMIQTLTSAIGGAITHL